MTPRPVKRKPRDPRFEIYTLRDTGEMDYFPHLRARGGDAEHVEALASLKDGTYQPFMAAVEYEGKYGKDYATFSASLKNTDIIASPQDGEFSANLDQERVEQLKELHTKDGHTQVPVRRKYYANPRQYYDHILLADGYTNSFAGTVIDTWCDFTIPREVKPVLKLRNPSGDSKADRERIKANQDVIDRLLAVDMWHSDNGVEARDEYFDVPLQQKLKAAFKQREVFGRSVIVKEHWDDIVPVTIDGTEFKELDNVLKPLHSIELGITEIELYTGKVAGVWLSNDQPYIPSGNMLYFINEYATPQIGAISYGFSKLQRSIDQVRLYRRLLARNFPQYLRTSASGMGAFFLNTTGYSDDTRKKIRAELRSTYKSAEIAVIDYANVKELEWKEFKINTDIAHLVQLEQAMLQTIANVIGVPQSIILDAGSPARATLVGRILTFMNNNVAQARTTFGQQLVNQWWMPNFRVVGTTEQIDEFYIDAEFVDVSMETKQEKIDRLLQETQLNPYTDEYIGEELEDPDYLAHIDEAKKEEAKQQQQQMGQPGSGGGSKGKTFSVRDHSTGDRKTFSES